MLGILINLVSTAIRVYIFIVIINALLSFVLSPLHPVRVALDRIVNPLLNPIRRMLPAMQMIDFSPTILIFVLVIVEQILVSILYTFR
ncbi:MAG: YggT family protein [Anaerolineaceae bacterium]|nr:YggT family protein [Anaerolineaceae bacterium]